MIEIRLSNEPRYTLKPVVDLNDSIVREDLTTGIFAYLGMEMEVPAWFPRAKRPFFPKPKHGEVLSNEEQGRIAFDLEKPFIERKYWEHVRFVSYEEGAGHAKQKKVKDPSEPFIPPILKGWLAYTLNLMDAAEANEVIKEVGKDYDKADELPGGTATIPVYRRIEEWWRFHRAGVEHIHCLSPIPGAKEGIQALSENRNLGEPAIAPVSIATNTPHYKGAELIAKLDQIGIWNSLDKKYLPPLAMGRSLSTTSSVYCKTIEYLLFALASPLVVVEDTRGVIKSLGFLRDLLKDQYGYEDRIQVHVPGRELTPEELKEAQWLNYLPGDGYINTLSGIDKVAELAGVLVR